jgi:hypothetical protein
LTDVARYVEINWVAWAGSLALAALGILAVFSANPLTLLLFWGAIDLVELSLLLNQVEGSLARERVVISFSARVFGILFLLAGILAAKGSGVPLTFERIPHTASVYLLLASILRLGIIPLHLPILHDPRQRRGLGTMSRLVPAAASLILLTRVAVSGVSANLEMLFLGISGVTALYASFSWLIAPDELEGRAYWMLGMASISLAAAVRGQPGASQAWGIALLLSGGLLFLFSARTRSLLILPLLGFFSLSTLPLTPTWPGVNLYLAPWSPWLAFLLLAQVLLLMGYLRHALRPEPGPAVIERWILFIYPLGLVFLLVAHLLIGWWGLLDAGPVTFERLLPGLLSLALLALGIFAWQNSPELPVRFRQKLRSVLGFQWLYRLLWEVYRTLSRLARFISLVLDGEGGVLWALLVLTLMIAFIIQGRFGG